MTKKEVKMILKIKSEKPDLPDWGLGKGVLASQVAVFPEDATDIEIAAKLWNLKQDFIDDNVEVIYEEA